MLCRMTEDVKRRLSVSESADVSDLMHGGEFLEINVTRAEFEAESRDLLSRIGERASALLRRNPDFIPEHVVLCGGASKMPMIGETLRAALPEYADRFAVFEPELSVCYGTARYAAMRNKRRRDVVRRPGGQTADSAEAHESGHRNRVLRRDEEARRAGISVHPSSDTPRYRDTVRRGRGQNVQPERRLRPYTHKAFRGDDRGPGRHSA